MRRSRRHSTASLALTMLAAPDRVVINWVLAINLMCIAGATLTGIAAGWASLSLITIVGLAWCFGWQRACLAGLAIALALFAAAQFGNAPSWLGYVANAAAVVSAGGLATYITDHAHRAYRRERHDARHDPLTGLLNRRAFFDRLDDLVPSLGRTGALHLLVFIDLDGFKQINDVYGHDAGDRVLQTCGASLRQLVAQEDAVARLGGDEFIALVRASDLDDPYTQADALHLDLSAALAELPYAPLGCSMGVIIITPPTDATRSALIGWADRLMYEVKRAGKGNLRIGHLPIKARAA